jgi:hypothetical protein
MPSRISRLYLPYVCIGHLCIPDSVEFISDWFEKVSCLSALLHFGRQSRLMESEFTPSRSDSLYTWNSRRRPQIFVCLSEEEFVCDDWLKETGDKGLNEYWALLSFVSLNMNQHGRFDHSAKVVDYHWSPSEPRGVIPKKMEANAIAIQKVSNWRTNQLERIKRENAEQDFVSSIPTYWCLEMAEITWMTLTRLTSQSFRQVWSVCKVHRNHVGG